jgi:hypothetical protein
MRSEPLSRVRRAAVKAAQARSKFETEIRCAVQERTMRQVAEAAGLSAARIHQIVHAKTVLPGTALARRDQLERE